MGTVDCVLTQPGTKALLRTACFKLLAAVVAGFEENNAVAEDKTALDPFQGPVGTRSGVVHAPGIPSRDQVGTMDEYAVSIDRPTDATLPCGTLLCHRNSPRAPPTLPGERGV
jgi:hypothetical protein